MKNYLPVLSCIKNRKGVIDVDTVKGCRLGMRAHPERGCYESCYALKMARGMNFRKSVSRKANAARIEQLRKILSRHKGTWFRIGVWGDPSHDCENTIKVIRQLGDLKTAVVITKHWIPITTKQLKELTKLNVIFNTSISALDSNKELKYRMKQIERLKTAGIKSVVRIVTCDFGETDYGKSRRKLQNYLLTLFPLIDNPLRISKSARIVQNGDVKVAYNKKSIGGGKYISMHDKTTHIGTCKNCPDKCGMSFFKGIDNPAIMRYK